MLEAERNLLDALLLAAAVAGGNLVDHSHVSSLAASDLEDSSNRHI